MRIAFVALFAPLLLIAAAGCSTPLDTGSDAGGSTPQVSLKPEDPPQPDTSADFDTATDFVQAVYTDQWDDAAKGVADNTLAARYVTYQAAYAQVNDLSGNPTSTDPSDINVSPDKDNGTLTIEDSSGDKPVTRVWKDFTFKDGKIASWNVEGSAALDARLWSAKASDSGKGVSAELVGAYQGSTKVVGIVVQLTSKDRDVVVETASYTPNGGFKHSDAANVVSELTKGDKTLTYFNFPKATVGGVLKIKFDTAEYDELATLELKVR